MGDGSGEESHGKTERESDENERMDPKVVQQRSNEGNALQAKITLV